MKETFSLPRHIQRINQFILSFSNTTGLRRGEVGKGKCTVNVRLTGSIVATLFVLGESRAHIEHLSGVISTTALRHGVRIDKL